MSLTRSQRAFSVAIGVTLIFTFVVPTRWLRPWTPELAALLYVFVQPLGQLGVTVRHWLRPVNDEFTGEVQKLVEDRDELRVLLHAARARNRELEEEISELGAARKFHQGVEIDTVFARITGRSPDRAGGLVRLNAGARHGVRAGTVAVFRGGHLIGRIESDVGRLSSVLVPITHPASGLIEAMILPGDDPDVPVEAAARIQLAPDGEGLLVGELDKADIVRAGDIVRLSDPAWPQSAQGMTLGLVASVRGDERRPLLNLVTVKPRYQAHRLASVTLKIERASAKGQES